MRLVQMIFDWIRNEPNKPAAPPAAEENANVRPLSKRVIEVERVEARVAALDRAEKTNVVSVRPRSGGRVGIVTRSKKRSTKQDLYDGMVRDMCARYNVRVRKWRKSMSGIAWYVEYRDGSIQRLIEAPRPKTPLSASIFLHEIGHHAIGFGVYKPRCLEEYHAWMYSLQQMHEWNIEVTDRVKTRVHRSLRYAAKKAMRRGIKKMPIELMGYLE